MPTLHEINILNLPCSLDGASPVTSGSNEVREEARLCNGSAGAPRW